MLKFYEKLDFILELFLSYYWTAFLQLHLFYFEAYPAIDSRDQVNIVRAALGLIDIYTASYYSFRPKIIEILFLLSCLKFIETFSFLVNFCI